jgi:aminopeptidase-like protein
MKSQQSKTPVSRSDHSESLLIAELNQIETSGAEMYRLIEELFPICRSITGEGVRETLRILRRHIPLDIRQVPSGTKVFDWIVPKEWNIRGAYVKDSMGRKIIDFERSNLHVVNYSTPINAKMSLTDLKPHLYTLPECPDWIPYRTSYYNPNWGFCLAHNDLLELSEGEYEVLIDSSFEDGHLTYGEYYLHGDRDAEVLISAHLCHPSLANDNLSGIAVATFLAKHLSGLSPRYSYRFLFLPGTIGSITWLSLNEARASLIKHGLVLTCIGDGGRFTYKKSRRGDAEIDRTAAHVLRSASEPFEIRDFSPYGYDERQYCSPGFNLPVGCLMRTPHAQFPEYHTSADNLDLVRPEHLASSLSTCLSIFQVIEHNRRYLNQNPKCEPQLGKRGIYSQIGGQADGKLRELAMLWVLNLSDGTNSLLDISEKSTLDFRLIHNAASTLQEHGLLMEVPEGS